MLVLGRAGIEIGGPITDTMVLSYLLESGERNHSLDQLSQRLLDHTMIPITDLIGKGKNQITMDQVEVAKVADYAGEDADATWRIEAILAPKVREEGLWDLYADLERPLIRVLAGMEAAGIKVDVPRLQAGSRREFAARIAGDRGGDLRAGRAPVQHRLGPAAPAGPVRRAEAPRRPRRPPAASRAPTSRSSKSWPRKHPLPRLLIEHRQLAKLKSTYLDALPTLVRPEDGRVHASFNQVVAATGRLSSSDPNLQNIPVRTEDGRQIRQAFVAGVPRLVAPDGRLLADRAADPGPLHRATRRWCGRSPRTATSTPRSPRGSSGARGGGRRRTSGGWPRRSTSA